jgi:general secretion pathway protein I
MSAPRRGHRREEGFTLLEVVVAFAVAALLLGVIYQVFSSGLRAGAAADDYSRALLLAESGLEAYTAPHALAAGMWRERISGRFQRETRVRPRADLREASLEVEIMPFEIEVIVEWRDGLRTRSLSLSTIRLAQSP